MHESIPQTAQRWLEIDLSAVRHNALAIKGLLRENCRMLAVVKDNAYGLGALEIARELEDIVQMFGVTTAEEGVELRQNGIGLPILVFAPPDNYNASLYHQYALTASIDNPSQIQALSDQNGNIDCHLKINTGMNRLGATGHEVMNLAQAIHDNQSLNLRGMYSHFYNAPASVAASRQQLQWFNGYEKALGGKGIQMPLKHIANSAAILNLPESQLDMVRCGTLLYGQSPVPLPAGLELKDPFKACCRVLAVHYLEKGTLVGYGGEYKTPKRRKVAVLPIGYSEGFGIVPQGNQGIWKTFKRFLLDVARIITKKPQFYGYLGSTHFPAKGRISMQLSTIDISDDIKIKEGDILNFSLRRTCASPRLDRVYYKDGEIVKVVKGIYNAETADLTG